MKDKIKLIVFNTAVEILNSNGVLFDSDNLVLFSNNGLFDSMDLVNFISIIEEKLLTEFNINLQLTHSSIFSSTRSPFKTVDSITDFIISII